MKITVDGSVVYLGQCEAGVYVRLGHEEQGARPVEVASTEMLKHGVLLDYDERGHVIGVEINAPTEKRNS